jgi:hypothetical protein
MGKSFLFTTRTDRPFFVLVLAAAVLLAACAPLLDTGSGNLSIRLSGGDRALAGTDTWTYRLDFYGPGGETFSRTAEPGTGVITLSVSLGLWRIRVNAYTPEGLHYGFGESSVVAAAGKTSGVRVSMTFAPVWYVSEDGNDDHTGSEANPLATVGKALELIQAAYQSNWSNNGGSEPAPARIMVSGTVAPLNGGTNGLVEITDSSGLYNTYPPIVLAGNGILSAEHLANDRVLSITNAKLTLEQSLTLTRGTLNGGSGAGVYVAGGGTFIMNGGSVSGNRLTGTSVDLSGAGVYVASSGTFTMNGGSVSGNSLTGTYVNLSGAGVYVASGGTFTMNGGSVEENTTTIVADSSRNAFGGGVYVASNGTFTMNGGSVKKNKLSFDSTSATIGLYGAGVYVTGTTSTFTMSGGSIKENEIIFNGSNTSHNGYGAGVYVAGSSTFTMSGGAIIEENRTIFNGNTSSSSGGGVYVAGSSTFTMSGGIINGNTATSAGGVYVTGASTTFTMSGGTINGNTASTSGGGVFVAGYSDFTMSGGAISGNTAATLFGGGVYVAGYSGFTISGGTISGNTAADSGGGVYVVIGGNFVKNTGSIIYGSDGEGVLENSAGNGHAVYVDSGPKKRDTTAGETVALDSSVSAGWE